mmetsp:Transcript_16168/g.50478  ORF Transcript_16168/g.50478 Transcript_16168/m.50478 type:complete len:488 (+) Transcript_16168:143-1606(+)
MGPRGRSQGEVAKERLRCIRAWSERRTLLCREAADLLRLAAASARSGGSVVSRAFACRAPISRPRLAWGRNEASFWRHTPFGSAALSSWVRSLFESIRGSPALPPLPGRLLLSAAAPSRVAEAVPNPRLLLASLRASQQTPGWEVAATASLATSAAAAMWRLCLLASPLGLDRTIGLLTGLPEEASKRLLSATLALEISGWDLPMLMRCRARLLGSGAGSGGGGFSKLTRLRGLRPHDSVGPSASVPSAGGLFAASPDGSSSGLATLGIRGVHSSFRSKLALALSRPPRKSATELAVRSSGMGARSPARSLKLAVVPLRPLPSPSEFHSSLAELPTLERASAGVPGGIDSCGVAGRHSERPRASETPAPPATQAAAAATAASAAARAASAEARADSTAPKALPAVRGLEGASSKKLAGVRGRENRLVPPAVVGREELLCHSGEARPSQCLPDPLHGVPTSMLPTGTPIGAEGGQAPRPWRRQLALGA